MVAQPNDMVKNKRINKYFIRIGILEPLNCVLNFVKVNRDIMIMSITAIKDLN